jgi:CRP/FNR family transcriptional regulator
MSDSAAFALHRPELGEALRRGDAKIARLMAPYAMSFASGTTLIGDDAEHCFVYRLVSGWAGRVRTLADGRSQFIMTFLPRDLFAVKSMFVTRHPDATVALSDIVVERIDQRKLREAYDADRDISTRCTWQVVEEERRLHNWVVGLGRGNAEERLAMLLIDFRGRLLLSGSIEPDTLKYELPMTQEQVGDHLGITNVHVSRVLKTFREAGIATMRSKAVCIEDLEALARIAAPLLDSFESRTAEFVGAATAAKVNRPRGRPS